ncbi:MAG: tyrosine-type recombinase/integrase [Terriglobia bacterium]
MNDIPTQKATRQRKGGTRDGLFQRNGWWWLDYYDAEGKRHRQKAAPDYETAKKLYREKMTGIAKGDFLGIREEGILLKRFVEDKYWPTIKGSLSFFEQRRSRSILDHHLLPRFGDNKLSKVRTEEIDRWQSERMGTASPGTVQKELMRLKHLLNCAVKWRYIKETPAKGLQTITTPPGRVRYLTPEERASLFQQARPELLLYIEVALQTGARRGELCSLRWADVDMRTRTLSFPKTKNGERRSVPITDTLYKLLQGLPRPLDPQALVLPALSADAVTIGFGRLVKELRLANLKFHDLRHDVASTLTMAGVPQRTIMEILGHKDPRMTLRYQHLSPDHLRRAIHTLETPMLSATEFISARN